jgi:hypothetical protein
MARTTTDSPDRQNLSDIAQLAAHPAPLRLSGYRRKSGEFRIRD